MSILRHLICVILGKHRWTKWHYPIGEYDMKRKTRYRWRCHVSEFVERW